MTQDHWTRGIPAVAAPPALGTHVLDSLRRLIITGGISPGTHLVEAQLSLTYAVSRGPVRDALRSLEAEGLVESRRRGVHVIGLTAVDVEELYSMRQVVEGLAVQLCLDAPSPDWAGTRSALRAMHDAARNDDAAIFATADLDFHGSFYVVAGHRRLAAIWQQYRPTFADMLSVTNNQDRDLGPVAEDHTLLLESVVARDPRSLDLLHDHVEGSRRRMLSAVPHG